MTVIPRAMTVLLAVCCTALCAARAQAQETVMISVPAGVSFHVTDITRATSGTPDPTRVSFSSADLTPGSALRITLQADHADFISPGLSPGGTPIAASHVSWKTLGSSGGLSSNGTLSAANATLVFVGDPYATSGHVDLAWTLAAPGSGVRAGTHDLIVRWKLEVITP